MDAFDPRNWRWPNGWRDDQPVDPNTEHLIRWSLLVASCACIASFAPPEMMAAAFSALLHTASLASALTAYFKEERVDAPHLTNWDEAAASLAIGLLLDILFPVQLPVDAGVGS